MTIDATNADAITITTNSGVDVTLPLGESVSPVRARLAMLAATGTDPAVAPAGAADEVETLAHDDHDGEACHCGGECEPCQAAAALAAATCECAQYTSQRWSTIFDGPVCGECEFPFAPARLEAFAALGIELATAAEVDELPMIVEDDDELDGALAAESATFGPMIDPANPGRWTATLLAEEEMTADGRIISKGATSWRTPPLPLMLMTETDEGHDGAVVCGVIEKITRAGAVIKAEGRFDTSETGAEAARLVRDRVLTSVSIDGGDVTAEIELGEDENGNETYTLRMTAITVLGATIVPFPAIASATIDYVTASAGPESVTEFVSGVIEWEAGDASGDALEALTASGPRSYPAELFADPAFQALTPLRVGPADENGFHRVFGHLAPWGECHIGIPGVCTMAPRSRTDYAYFLTGEVPTTDGGRQRVGTVTMSGDHAHQNLSAADAQRHYDNTALAAAYVNVGEDKFGIWVSGVLAPNLDEHKATELAASGALSGDWRRIGGNLELVAALAVNVPGFPVIGLRDDQQLSLVAAGYGVARRERSVLAAQVDGLSEAMGVRFEAIESTIAAMREELLRLSRQVQPLAAERTKARLAALLDGVVAAPEVVETLEEPDDL